jgi:protein-disulfide isomerase
MNQHNLTIPFAIVAAGALVGGALIMSRSNNNASDPAAVLNAVNQRFDQTLPVPPISVDDHVLGNPEAPIVLIEYSDTECPFCKQFHATMHRVMDEYGKGGQVAWVYRHFPLADIHDKSPKEAEAAECAAELGGPSSFWGYLDKIYAITPSNNGLNASLLPQIAEDIGINKSDFEKCLKSGRHAQKVAGQFSEAIAAGAQGTPFTVLMFSGSAVPLEGAQPYASVKGLIDQILGQVSQLAPSSP